MTEHTSPSSDDDALSALIDGALPSDEADALRARIAREPMLAARLAAMELANRAVRDAYRDVVDEPLPERVLELLRAPPSRAGEVVDLDERRRRRALPAWVPQAAAAGVVLAIGLGLGFGLGQRSSDAPAAGVLAATGRVAPGSALEALLESVPSGEPREIDGATAEARFTFRAQGGDWCRELAVSAGSARNAAVACRRDGGWRVELVGVQAAGGEVYRPAGADTPLREAVDALIDGEPLEPDAERALVARGWAND
jgi:negative regulator of sigma E activity